MALNANKEIDASEGPRTRGPMPSPTSQARCASSACTSCGSAFWIAVNLGILGVGLQFDKYPFGLLTLVVSLEAIFLSTFVMISQNRQARAAEIRSELDYRTNVIAEREIDVIMKALHRMAEQQGVEVDDLIIEITGIRQQMSDTA